MIISFNSEHHSRDRRIGFQLVGNTPAEFAAALRDEQNIWKPVLEAVGLAKK